MKQSNSVICGVILLEPSSLRQSWYESKNQALSCTPLKYSEDLFYKLLSVPFSVALKASKDDESLNIPNYLSYH